MVNVIDRHDRLCLKTAATRTDVVKSNSSSYYTSASQHLDEWCTPPNIIELVLQVLNEIDLDPCAEGNKNIPARSHYTKIDDGLQHEWYGRLFINPPFSHPAEWIAKLQAELLNGRVSEAIALLPAATDTDWLNSVLKTQPVCFWKERIIFLDADLKPNLLATQSHCLVYWGNNQYKFRQIFEQYGIVYLPIWKSDEDNQPSTDEVLPVNSTSSTVSTIEQDSQTVLPVNSTSSTVSTIEQDSQTVLPVNSTSSTVSTIEQDSRTVLPINSTSSTVSTIEQDSQTVLPVNLTSSTVSTIEQDSQTVLPVNSTSSTKRRGRGKGTGRIHWRTVTKRNGKQYEQPWYDWQLNMGKKTISKSTYIPKHLFSIILELEINKAPVNEILAMLGIIL
ncbi:C-5 cytosine-specific DNA methylase [Calothrix sp. NIES-4071]|nr:C-5 cytosine-specific DNA methylase [Calothrix sp. NIES-4071]BAZ57079.1 C-5 cytosine-specific DNA methylase [Calothrix sp. NIES-4105]